MCFDEFILGQTTVSASFYTTHQQNFTAQTRQSSVLDIWPAVVLSSYTSVRGLSVGCVCLWRCRLLTLSHRVKGLNEGFDSSSGLRVGLSAGVSGCGLDHWDAAPVTVVVRLGRSHLIALGPARHIAEWTECLTQTVIYSLKTSDKKSTRTSCFWSV